MTKYDILLSMGARRNKQYSKQRKFHGNQHTVIEAPREDTFICHREEEKRSSTPLSVVEGSSLGETNFLQHHTETPLTTQRLRTSYGDENDESTNDLHDYFLMVNFKHLVIIIEAVGHCPNCLGRVKLQNQLQFRMGFACKLNLSCYKCKWEQDLYTSGEVNLQKGPGRKYYEVNVRAAVAFREIGKGHQGLENFSRLMNMRGILSKGYEKISHEVHEAYEKVGTTIMSKAASEVHAHGKETLNEGPSIVLCECSVDGTWQKRGHSSYNGVVTAISNGKFIDRHVMSKYCRGCQKWKTKQGTIGFENWKAEHRCPINHTKSSGAMEAAGAVAMFNSTGSTLYKKSIILPIWIHDIIKPIFQELSSDELLSKCLQSKTQNANESLNNLIWRKCPKNVFVQRDTLECAVNSAVIEFNESPCGINDVLREIGVSPSVLTPKGSNKKALWRNKSTSRNCLRLGRNGGSN